MIVISDLPREIIVKTVLIGIADGIFTTHNDVINTCTAFYRLVDIFTVLKSLPKKLRIPKREMAENAMKEYINKNKATIWEKQFAGLILMWGNDYLGDIWNKFANGKYANMLANYPRTHEFPTLQDIDTPCTTEMHQIYNNHETCIWNNLCKNNKFIIEIPPFADVVTKICVRGKNITKVLIFTKLRLKNESASNSPAYSIDRHYYFSSDLVSFAPYNNYGILLHNAQFSKFYVSITADEVFNVYVKYLVLPNIPRRKLVEMAFTIPFIHFDQNFREKRTALRYELGLCGDQ